MNPSVLPTPLAGGMSLDPPTAWPADLRPLLTAYLHQRLAAFQDGFRHNVALLGPLGSGKSTLLQRGLESADGRFIKIYCLLQRDPVREFLRRFSAALLRGALAARADAPLEWLEQQAAGTMPDTVAAIQHLDRYAGGHQQAEAFVHALDLVALAHKELGRPCILVLDEFLHLEELGAAQVFHELGKRVMTWPFTLFLLSSSSSFRARTILRERLHLLFGQFELMTPGPVEIAAAAGWLEQEPIGQPDTERAGPFLLHWVGSSPWYLGVLLRRIKELQMIAQGQDSGAELPALSMDRLRLQPEPGSILVQAAWDLLGRSDGVLFQRCDARIEQLVRERYGPIAREALLQIAQGARTTPAIARQSGMRRSLSGAFQTLIEHDLIERKGNCWVIADQLLACWLSAVFAVRKDGAAVDETEARQRFEQVLRGIWMRWVETAAQPLASRIRRLFGQFRNETIALDHRNGRLPSFRSTSLRQPSGRDEVYLVADGDERRWCCVVSERRLDEPGIAAFEQFCRRQDPRPTRKIVVSAGGLELNATLLAKESTMWVWEPEDVDLLLRLYGQGQTGR